MTDKVIRFLLHPFQGAETSHAPGRLHPVCLKHIPPGYALYDPVFYGTCPDIRLKAARRDKFSVPTGIQRGHRIAAGTVLIQSKQYLTAVQADCPDTVVQALCGTRYPALSRLEKVIIIGIGNK